MTASITKCNLSTQIQEIISLLDNPTPNNQPSKPTSNYATKSQQQTELKDNVNEDIDDNKGGWDGRPKTARGTRDYGPGDMIIREEMMTSIKKNFKKFGGQFMETPVFELRDILMDKYGEDEKLIYDLAKQEAETLCLRYDLTVPLARYIAMNRKDIKSPFKAARVGRVYRRDQPYMTKGRLREFWQCDFDIVRTGFDEKQQNALDLVFDDMEVVTLTIQQLRDLIGDKFVLLINNRKLLDAVLDICKVPADKVRAISSAIDKLDKKEWECVKEEMVEKGIDGDTAEMIRRFTVINGAPDEVLEKLKADKYLKERLDKKDKGTVEAIKEFELLLSFVKGYNAELMKFLRIDMSMVRGLDYYTGIIMEAQFSDKEVASAYGSIAGGGRYDKLVSRFVTSKTENFPCVGSSLGFERIFSYLKNTKGIDVGVSTDILVCEIGEKKSKDDPDYKGLFEERLKLLAEFRDKSGLDIETMNKLAPLFIQQVEYAENRGIKWMVLIGNDEIQSNTVNLRRLTLVGDIIKNKDGKLGIVKEIIQPEEDVDAKKDNKKRRNKKFEFRIEPIIDLNDKRAAGKKKKDWIYNKKQIAKIVQNGIDFDENIKGIKRDELIGFFKKIYANDNDTQ